MSERTWLIMPIFRFTAVNIKNKSIHSGSISATDINMAIYKIMKNGLTPCEIVRVSGKEKAVYERIRKLKSKKSKLEISLMKQEAGCKNIESNVINKLDNSIVVLVVLFVITIIIGVKYVWLS